MKLFTVIVLLALTLTGCVEAIYNIKHKAQKLGQSELMKSRALAGDSEAQYHLGKLYCCGESPEYDNVEALRWWCMAAKSNQRDAMLEVGQLYETSHQYKGSIIPRNNVLAYTYYTKAVENGNDDAIEPKERLQSLLSEDDMENANYLIKQWPVIGCEVTR